MYLSRALFHLYIQIAGPSVVQQHRSRHRELTHKQSRWDPPEEFECVGIRHGDLASCRGRKEKTRRRSGWGDEGEVQVALIEMRLSAGTPALSYASAETEWRNVWRVWCLSPRFFKAYKSKCFHFARDLPHETMLFGWVGSEFRCDRVCAKK